MGVQNLSSFLRPIPKNVIFGALEKNVEKLEFRKKAVMKKSAFEGDMSKGINN